MKLTTCILILTLSVVGITLTGQVSAAPQTTLQYCEHFHNESSELDSYSGFNAVGRTEILKKQDASEFDNLLPLEKRCVVNPDVYNCACDVKDYLHFDLS